LIFISVLFHVTLAFTPASPSVSAIALALSVVEGTGGQRRLLAAVD